MLNRLAARLSRVLDLDKSAPDLSSSAPRDDFFRWSATLPSTARAIEFGTKQSVPGRSTHLHGMFPEIPRDQYLLADVEMGHDVDLVADLHDLPADWSGRFDAVVAIAVFEHLERPWLAAKEIARILKPGGRCYVATHQTYPLHGYPSDFFRFSRDALALLFADAGMGDIQSEYEHRTWIRLPRSLVPRRYGKRLYVEAWNRISPSYIIVHLMAGKPES